MAKRNDLAELSMGELIDELKATKQEALNLRFRNATGQLDNTAEIGKVRSDMTDAVEEMTETTDRAARKVREGTVISNKMDKTAVVEVVDRVRHAKYNKFVLRTKKLHAHDEANDVNIGDKVRVMETRPLSKKKRWRVTDVLERAK